MQVIFKVRDPGLSETLGPLLLIVLTLEPIVVNTTTTANRDMNVNSVIKSIQTIVTITANAVIAAIVCPFSPVKK